MRSLPTKATISSEDAKLYRQAAPIIDSQFTKRYRATWVSQYKTEDEKAGILLDYIDSVKKMGGYINCRKVLRWLASNQNTRFTKFPPNPQEFLILYRQIPKPFAPVQVKAITKHTGVTFAGRVYSGIAKLAAGAPLGKSHEDIRDLVLYNYAKYEEHRHKHGDRIPGAKNYEFYELDLKGGKK